MPDGGVTSLIDIQDSWVADIDAVLGILNLKVGVGGVSYDAWEREATERFFDIGFKIEVKWWHTNVEGVKIPEIEIQERTGSAFDPDRQVHEATADILDLGTRGVIKGGL